MVSRVKLNKTHAWKPDASRTFKSYPMGSYHVGQSIQEWAK